MSNLRKMWSTPNSNACCRSLFVSSTKWCILRLGKNTLWFREIKVWRTLVRWVWKTLVKTLYIAFNSVIGLLLLRRFWWPFLGKSTMQPFTIAKWKLLPLIPTLRMSSKDYHILSQNLTMNSKGILSGLGTCPLARASAAWWSLFNDTDASKSSWSDVGIFLATDSKTSWMTSSLNSFSFVSRW